MNQRSAKKKIAPSSILALLIGIGFIAVGVFHIVTSRIDAREYKNSTDIRIVDALVEECRKAESKDANTNKRTVLSYGLKISFAVDGNSYTAKGRIDSGNRAFRDNIQRGDTISIEVYRTSKGQYKITPSNDALDFLFAWCMIPLGAVFFLAPVYDLTVRKPDPNSVGTGKKSKKRQESRRDGAV